MSLNVKKTELTILRKLKICQSFKFKLDGKRLVLTRSFKYLGVLLDEQLNWNQQITQVKMRLNRVICILNKLGSDTKTAYHSLFESHLQYTSQLWSQKKNCNIPNAPKPRS